MNTHFLPKSVYSTILTTSIASFFRDQKINSPEISYFLPKASIFTFLTFFNIVLKSVQILYFETICSSIFRRPVLFTKKEGLSIILKVWTGEYV